MERESERDEAFWTNLCLKLPKGFGDHTGRDVLRVCRLRRFGGVDLLALSLILLNLRHLFPLFQIRELLLLLILLLRPRKMNL